MMDHFNNDNKDYIRAFFSLNTKTSSIKTISSFIKKKYSDVILGFIILTIMDLVYLLSMRSGIT